MDGAELEPGRPRAHLSSLVLLLGILLLASILRFNQAGTIPLRADEAANYYLAIKSPDSIVRALLAGDPHLPLFYVLLHYWIAVAGNSELSLRYLTIFSAVLVIPLVYALGKRLFPRSNLALIGAFLAAINPYSVWDAQDAYMYSMLTATGLASFIAFERILRPRAPRTTWLAYIAFSALALYVHYLAGLILIAQGVMWLLLTAWQKLSWRTSVAWLGAQAAIGALLAPWLFFAFPLLSSLNQTIWRPVGLVELLARSLAAFSVGRVDSSLMPPMIDSLAGSFGAALLFLLSLMGMLLARRPPQQDLRARILLTGYLWGPLFAFFIFTLVRFPVFDERYVLFLIPPFLLLVARGVTIIQERTGRAAAAGIPLLVIMLLGARSLANYWYIPAYAKSPDWPAFVRQLSADYQQGDLLIQNYPDSALPYYLHDAVPTVLVPGRGSADAQSVASRLIRLTSTYGRVWFQPAAGANWDTGGVTATWLDRHAKFVRAYSFRGVQLELFVPAAKAVTNATKSETLFANDVRLIGFELGLADEASAGAQAQIVLYWQPTAAVVPDATVFLHLYDDNGKLVSQQDSEPVQGSYPTHDWAKGEIIVDVHELQIPAGLTASDYPVVVGMYDSETKQRIPILKSQGPLLSENRAVLTKIDLK